MQFASSRTAMAFKEMVTPPSAEALDGALSQDNLLLELRATHIVLAETQKRLNASLRRDVQFAQLALAYRAALKECARETRLRKQLENALAAKRIEACDI